MGAGACRELRRALILVGGGFVIGFLLIIPRCF